MNTRMIAGGAWCRVVIDGVVMGLVTGASYDEDWGVTPAKVLNHHGPIDYDSQDYSCRITLQAFVPEPSAVAPYPDGGAKAFVDMLPTRRSVQGNSGRPGMFGVLQFVSTSSSKVLAQFENVMVSSNGIQVAPNSFVTANIQLMAVERVPIAASI